MNRREQVLKAAHARAAALTAGDARSLADLLHVDFRWTSHQGEQFDRAAYIESNTAGRIAWQGQDLGDPEVLLVGDAAILRTVVTDTIDTATGEETFRMPMTLFWVYSSLRWRLLAGHAGPRLA